MRSIIAMLVLLVCLANARGAISGGPGPSLNTDTIEALTIESPVILTGIASPNCTLASFEVVKAPPGFAEPTPLPMNLVGSEAELWPAPGTHVLVFLSDYGHCQDFVILDPPFDAVPLNGNPARDLTMRPIRDSREILATVKAELTRVPPSPVEYYFVYPFNLNVVPNDERLLPAARQWATSSDPMARYLAASVFKAHPDVQDTPALRTMLNDPYTIQYPFWLSPWSAHEYIIRRTAADSLQARGEAFAMPMLSLPRTDLYHPIHWFLNGLVLSIPLIAFAMWRRRRRGKCGLPTPSRRQSLISYATFTCLYLATVMVPLWVRSEYTADDLVFAQNGLLLNADSIRGNLWLEAAVHWPEKSPLVRLSVTPGLPQDYNGEAPEGIAYDFRNGMGTDDPDERHSLATTYFYSNDSWARGIDFHHRAESILTGAWGPSSSYPGIAAGIAYPCLLALLLLFPASRLLMHITRAVITLYRTRQRTQASQCPACAYDLRAHQVGDRCPECGREIDFPIPSSPEHAPR